MHIFLLIRLSVSRPMDINFTDNNEKCLEIQTIYDNYVISNTKGINTVNIKKKKKLHFGDRRQCTHFCFIYKIIFQWFYGKQSEV